MMMHPETATTKWCPFAMVQKGNTGSLNRYRDPDDKPEDHKHINCIANQCMLWRWHADNLGFCGMGSTPTHVTPAT